ncbi:hypothetical protein HDU85_006965 [Gaertneriomyces sp. JEL0708]|nr:hypothetical protein HDU85_006965 [Gaertneriomyces sp. JEL0708]
MVDYEDDKSVELENLLRYLQELGCPHADPTSTSLANPNHFKKLVEFIFSKFEDACGPFATHAQKGAILGLCQDTHIEIFEAVGSQHGQARACMLASAVRMLRIHLRANEAQARKVDIHGGFPADRSRSYLDSLLLRDSKLLDTICSIPTDAMFSVTFNIPQPKSSMSFGNEHVFAPTGSNDTTESLQNQLADAKAHLHSLREELRQMDSSYRDRGASVDEAALEDFRSTLQQLTTDLDKFITVFDSELEPWLHSEPSQSPLQSLGLSIDAAYQSDARLRQVLRTVREVRQYHNTVIKSLSGVSKDGGVVASTS